jgi:protein associated with RNAse G/E
VSVSDNVLLVPRDRGMTAMFYTEHPEQAFELYVDITTPAVWDDDVVTAVDLDLDVIRRFDGSWFVDDEDEFAEHQVTYGYPPELVADAEAECARVAAEIRSGATVLTNATAEPWKAAFRALPSR